MPSLDLPHRYENLGLLGEGGSGRVLRVNDQARGRIVALKLVGPVESVWLRREFDTLRQIRHENLVRVFDWGVLTGGDSYYTMELVSGDLSRELLQPMAPERVAFILCRILRGLAHLHSHEELHGDLKPSNVLLGSGGVVKLSDVGMGGGSPAAHDASGTPGYTAPEVWEGAPKTRRGDIYSAGIIAYEAATGRHPFAARTIRGVIAGQFGGWVPSPQAYGIQLPPKLERGIMRALERDPELRFATADEFLEAIGATSAPGEIIGGRFVSRTEELARIRDLLTDTNPGTPILLYVAGPSGIGKTSVVKEAAHRYAEIRELFNEVSLPQRDLLVLAGEGPRASTPLAVSVMAARLERRFPEGAVFFLDNSPDPSGLLRDLARYTWAEATERGVHSRFRFIQTIDIPPQRLEQFESSLSLRQFGDAQAHELMRGLLGEMEDDASLPRKLVEEVGGTPEALIAAVLEMVERNILCRRFGKWLTASPSTADWALLRATTSHWIPKWVRLSDQHRLVLTAVNVVRSGLRLEHLRLAFPDVDVMSVVSQLAASSWLEVNGDAVKTASRECGRVIQEQGSATRAASVIDTLLNSIADQLPRVDKVTLELVRLSDSRVVQEGLWLGGELSRSAQFEDAIWAYLRVAGIARSIGEYGAAQQAALLAGEELQRLGETSRVLAVLEDNEEWSESVCELRTSAARARLRGLAFKAKKELEAASKSFSECSRSALQCGDVQLWLQAEAELSEIEWRYGGEAGRKAAAERVDRLSQFENTYPIYSDEWAAIKYQLGASLVTGGKRDAAVAILETAAQQARSSFWLMRISNALAAAHYYLGEFRAGLAAAKEAWRYAGEGAFDSFKPRVLASMAGLTSGLGMYREAAEQDELAAFWGRRLGSPFEYEAGLLARMADVIHLAQYEEALRAGEDVRDASKDDPESRHVAKSYEMEASVWVHMGAYSEASACVEKAESILEGRGFDDLLPRLRWHTGRVLMERGDFGGAETNLRGAMAVLEETRDWEDLPGVQIELQLVFARAGDKRLNMEQVAHLLREARSKEVCLVQLRATLAMAEIACITGKNSEYRLDGLMEGLRLAEKSGAREFVWRLSYWVGRLLAEGGDLRGAAARISNGVRVMREVVEDLRPSHREAYLATSHARLLLSASDLVRDSPHGQQD